MLREQQLGSETIGLLRDHALCEDLERFVALLRQWQSTHNLVGAGDMDAIWTRHIADSLQLLPAAPPFREWVDLGSGAGFPGLAIAIASRNFPDRHFTL